jgi:hypothetical protein
VRPINVRLGFKGNIEITREWGDACILASLIGKEVTADYLLIGSQIDK